MEINAKYLQDDFNHLFKLWNKTKLNNNRGCIKIFIFLGLPFIFANLIRQMMMQKITKFAKCIEIYLLDLRGWKLWAVMSASIQYKKEYGRPRKTLSCNAWSRFIKRWWKSSSDDGRTSGRTTQGSRIQKCISINSLTG